MFFHGPKVETEDQYWVICFKQPSRHYVFSWSQKKKTSGVLGAFFSFLLVGFPYGALGEDWRKSFQELVERHGKRLTLHFGEALEEVPRRHTWAMKSQGPWLFRVYRGLYTCCLAKKNLAFSKNPSLKLPYILKIDPLKKGAIPIGNHDFSRRFVSFKRSTMTPGIPPTSQQLARWTWPPAVAARQRRPGCPMTTCWVLMGWTRWCGKLWQRPVKR